MTVQDFLTTNFNYAPFILTSTGNTPTRTFFQGNEIKIYKNGETEYLQFGGINSYYAISLRADTIDKIEVNAEYDNSYIIYCSNGENYSLIFSGYMEKPTEYEKMDFDDFTSLLENADNVTVRFSDNDIEGSRMTFDNISVKMDEDEENYIVTLSGKQGNDNSNFTFRISEYTSQISLLPTETTDKVISVKLPDMSFSTLMFVVRATTVSTTDNKYLS